MPSSRVWSIRADRLASVYSAWFYAWFYSSSRAIRPYGLPWIALWCPGRESNPHTLRRQDLNLLRLPISPPGLCHQPNSMPDDRGALNSSRRHPMAPLPSRQYRILPGTVPRCQLRREGSTLPAGPAWADTAIGRRLEQTPCRVQPGLARHGAAAVSYRSPSRTRRTQTRISGMI